MTEQGVIKIGDHVSIAAIERAHIERVLATTNTLHEAANVLGIDYATLYRKRKQWGIEIDRPRGRRAGQGVGHVIPANRLAKALETPPPAPVRVEHIEVAIAPVPPPPPPPAPAPAPKPELPPLKPTVPPSVERVTQESLLFKTTPPEGMPQEMHNQHIMSLFRIMLRLLEPKHTEKTGLLHVDDRTLSILRTLSTFEWRNPRNDQPTLQGFLSLHVPMPGMMQFRGWDVALNNELSSGNFHMFANGHRLVGHLE